MAQLYALFEHATGYCLFQVEEFEEIGSFLPQVEAAANDAAKFKKVVHLVGFRPFASASVALSNINAISEGLLTEELSGFLDANLPKKRKKITLGITDPKLGAAINEALKIPVTHTGVVPEVLRGIRFHLHHFIKGLTLPFMKQSELGLGHSYSRGKVKFNVNKVDNMIIQSIALIDQLDKDINTFVMRIREWYSYHFPELAQVVTDNYQYALCANFIKNRTTLSEGSLEKLEVITMDSAKAQAILDAARMSMGMEISVIDLLNIERFATRVIGLSEYRIKLAEYLRSKMGTVAPNLSTLIGEVVGARLISHAGSLTNLAKMPASTVQILGAEKALFRALKTRSNTPKYGLIYHSTFIGRAGTTNKGRISRCLANKCSLATRIDCFSDSMSNIFGVKLRDQIEERLKFYETGDLPRKNVEVMAEALEEHTSFVAQQAKERKKNKKKRKKEDVSPHTPPKKKVKVEPDEQNEMQEVFAESPKKKKKSLNSDGDLSSLNISQESSLENGTSSYKKKKKKKIFNEEDDDADILDPSAFDITFDSSILTGQEATDSIQKKKKKKKSKHLSTGE